MTQQEIQDRIAVLQQEDFDIGVSSDYLTPWQMNRIGEIAREIIELKAQLTDEE